MDQMMPPLLPLSLAPVKSRTVYLSGAGLSSPGKHTTTTVLQPFGRDQLGEPVPEEAGLSSPGKKAIKWMQGSV